MRTRSITVPLNAKAQKSLDFDDVDDSQIIELLIDDDDFEMLFQKGIFDLINSSVQVNIDDYEDESITEAEALQKVTNALIEESFKHSGNKLLIHMIYLFSCALNRGTGVFFFF
jgi:hypothetical protein